MGAKVKKGQMKTIVKIDERWEKGMDHHPESEALVRLCAEIDFQLNGDSMCLKFGGDGDNGEAFAYLLDIIFDARDNGETEKLKALLSKKQF